MKKQLTVAFLTVVLATSNQAGNADFPEITNTQNPADQPPTPVEAAGKITVPQGFKVTLFAGEPDVQQPIAFDIDDAGRLWVAENYTYSGRGFTEEFRDRIVILQDSDHDGQFDQRKVFWNQGDRLTGLTLGFGGVWILNAGQLQWLPDKDGDDEPDGLPVVLLDGFDTQRIGHNVVNGLLWGPDGWLYGRHGITATSLVGAPGTPDYERTKLNCSIWRFHPTRHIFEVVTNGTTNPWGLDYNDFGEMFFTNNVIGHLWHVVPGAHYKRMFGEDFNPHLYDLLDQCADHYHWDTGKGWTDSRDGKGVHGELGGGHSHCGGMIYLGDNWPAKYRNSIFMCNTHGRRINQNTLRRHRSGYVGGRAPDFMFANQPWFRGVELKYGPDGGVYVTDWVDLGECHDHDGVHRTSGRIYKIVYVGDGGLENPQIDVPQIDVPRTDVPRTDVGRLAPQELVKLQLHPNDWYVRHARRRLQELAVDGANLKHAASQLLSIFETHPEISRKLRALWALYAIGETPPGWLQEQLAHEDEHVRVWAIRLLVDHRPVSQTVVEQFSQMAQQEDSGLVRHYLASATQKLPLKDRWSIISALAAHAEDADDPNLPLMMWYAIEPAVPENPSAALRLATSTRIPRLRRYIARRLTAEIDRKPAPVEDLLGLLKGTEHVTEQLDILQGMSDALRGWRKAPVPASWSDTQLQLEKTEDPKIRAQLQELAVVFGDGRAMEDLRKIAMDAGRPPTDRRRALELLIQSQPPDLSAILLKLVNDRATNLTAIRGLATTEQPQAANAILNQMTRLDANDRQTAIDTLVSRVTYAQSLLNAVERGHVSVAEISAFHARQMTNLGNEKLTQRLEKLWGAVRQTPAEKMELIQRYKSTFSDAAVAKNADLSQGRLQFNRVCGNCHTLYGQGGKIGPDITGSNRRNLDYLLENVIDPSAVVARDYQMSQFELTSGRIITGIIVAQSERTLTVQTQKERLVVDRNDIEQMQQSPLSLMPDGLLQPLTSEEIRDLIAYLRSDRQVPLPPELPAASN